MCPKGPERTVTKSCPKLSVRSGRTSSERERERERETSSFASRFSFGVSSGFVSFGFCTLGGSFGLFCGVFFGAGTFFGVSFGVSTAGVGRCPARLTSTLSEFTRTLTFVFIYHSQWVAPSGWNQVRPITGNHTVNQQAIVSNQLRT